MNNFSSTYIDIYFSMPVSAKNLFNFVILPANMPLYKGFMLIPAIKEVNSSDPIRQIGTRDYITNSDKSSHLSTTINLIEAEKYTLDISDIQVVGIKKMLSWLIVGFSEDWQFFEKSGPGPHSVSCSIHRQLEIRYARGIFAHLLVLAMIRPMLLASFYRHHFNINKALKKR